MENRSIILKGLRENNLKNISLEIPKGKITVFTGVSGSGKSSVVFDTIAQESGRQLNETFSFLVRMFLPRYRQPDADVIENLSAAVVIDQSRLGGTARSTLGTITDINTLIRFFFSRFGDKHIGYGNAFSFNDPSGMCPMCEGIGKIQTLDIEKALDMGRSLNEGAILLPGYAPGSVMFNLYAGVGIFDADKKLKNYSPSELERLINGKAEKVKYHYRGSDITVTYEGLSEKFLRQNLTEREKSDKAKERFARFAKIDTCPLCGGKRYNERALSVRVMGRNIFEMTDMQVSDLMELLGTFSEKRGEPVIATLLQRLQILSDIGLDYMTLTRETATLSGGESQRVKMVKHLSCALNDMLYIFDEPSIGLHPHDVVRMTSLLKNLRDKGNTVIVVEHDPDVIKIADHVVDMGPLAGSKGGEVVYQGSYGGLLDSGTLTGRFINKSYPTKEMPRPYGEFFESPKSSLHNLKNVSLKIPAGCFTVVSGVAGSGKSTLVNEVFASAFPQAVCVDQRPPHTNIRSNPATFLGFMDEIRKLFAKENGVSAGMFSYNSEGACPHCKGTGFVELNLSYMESMSIPCEECGGTRFTPDALQYLYNGKSIVEVLAMTAYEARDFFSEKKIAMGLEAMCDVGLGYVTLGQPHSTLSGGECQRLKLAQELRKKGNIYILDEPTTGLHRSDIENLLGVVDRLIGRGNTVIAIEHNLDVMKQADHIIDMGPWGGQRGGEILFEGRPAELLKCENSVTAKYLRESL